MATTLSFKCYLEGKGGEKEIRRFTLDSDVIGNFTYMQEKIRSIYPQLLRESFIIQYIDDEQDCVTISSDDELVSALMYVKREASEPFRLIVKLQGSVSASKPDSITTTSQGNCQGQIHLGVTCDGCQSSIRGFRYKCFQCPDFDLCGKCETAGIHPGHSMIRVNGVMPPSFAAMRHLIVGGGHHEVPHWRRKHHGRNACGVNLQRGNWSAWCPSGNDVPDVTSEDGSSKKDEKTDDKKQECPFKTNVENAKKAAEAFQETAPDFLMNLGTTIASILSQFGVDTQVDVHGPNTGGACPRETAQKKVEKDEEQSKTETKKEFIIPVRMERDAAQEQKSKQEELATGKESVLPVTVEMDFKQEQEVQPNPYASVIQAIAAVQAAERAQEAARAAQSAVPFETATAVARAAEEAAKAASQASSSHSERSPSPHSDGWTLVEDEKKDAQRDLGARPKSPPQPPVPLHPDPIIGSALETMLAMGFTNEGGWLAQLLEVKGGDIGKALDVLQTRRSK